MTGKECRELIELKISPHVRERLKDSFAGVPFTLVFDDDRHVTVGSKVSVLIRYYSSALDEIVTTYLGLLAIDRRDVEFFANSIVNLLDYWHLAEENLFGLLVDGLEDIAAKKAELIELLRPACPNVVSLSSSFSSLAMAMHRAVKKNVPSEIEYALRYDSNIL